MKRKVISVLLAIFLLLVTFMQVIYASSYSDQKNALQNKINEAKDEKDEVTSEKKSTMSEIESLDNTIAQYEKEINELEESISKLQKDIKSKTKEIEELQSEFEEKQELLEHRLVAIYEEGQVTFLDAILSSESIWDYFSIEARMKEMAEADNKQLDELEAQRKAVEKAKNELQEKKDKLDDSKKTVESKQTQVKVTKASKQAKIATLTDKEKALQKEIDAYNNDIADIDRKIREQAQNAAGVYSGSFSGTLGWPLSSSSPYYNVITSKFGYRTSPTAGASSNHRGVDIGVIIGTPVYASADGYVLSVMQTNARGKFVLIKHADDLYTRYQHLSRYVVSAGQYVKRGQLIAYSGNTGVGSGPHLHFEVLTTPYYMSEINPLTCGLVSLPNLIY